MRLFFSGILGIILITAFANGGNEPLCVQSKDKVHCLLEHYDELKAQPSLFEKTFLDAKKQAIKCKNEKMVSEFLKLSLKIGGSAAIEEYFSEAMEKDLLINNPKCFLDAVTELSTEAKMKICSMLKHPTFLEKDQVAELYQKYHEKPGTEGWVATCLK